MEVIYNHRWVLTGGDHCSHTMWLPFLLFFYLVFGSLLLVFVHTVNSDWLWWEEGTDTQRLLQMSLLFRTPDTYFTLL